MSFNQIQVCLLLLSLGLVNAQQPRLGAYQGLAELQRNKPAHPLLVNAGLPQWLQSDPRAGSPAVASFGFQLQAASDAQGQQVAQKPVKKLTWHFPAAPQIPTRPAPVHFVRQAETVSTQGVTVQCGEAAVHVKVRRDLFGTDAPLNIDAFTLGGCAAKEVASSHVLVYESPLHGCNSSLTVTANELVYIFTLGVAPVPLSSTPIQRSEGAMVFIECHYPRLHNVSSNALEPTWIPYASAHAAEQLLVLSLNFMIADWASVRPSNQYHLGELINIEASVMQFNHVPLRVLVDSCVATTVPDINAVPRYSFIEHYGCLTDAKLTQSRSRFLPQTEASKLRFQLEAFRFQEEGNSLIYIACLLKATAASAPADAEHKACSFTDNRWIAAYGAAQACSCCNSNCALRKGRDLSSEQGLQLERKVSLGPIMILENV